MERLDLSGVDIKTFIARLSFQKLKFFEFYIKEISEEIAGLMPLTFKFYLKGIRRRRISGKCFWKFLKIDLSNNYF